MPWRWPWSARPPLSRQGEDLAARYLRRQGFEILDRNLRLGRYELDIVAREGDTIAFVEVKTRRSADLLSPEVNVDRRKRAHIRSAAQAYIDRRDRSDEYYRFDVVTVVLPENGRPQIELLRDAFQAQE